MSPKSTKIESLEDSCRRSFYHIISTFFSSFSDGQDLGHEMIQDPNESGKNLLFSTLSKPRCLKIPPKVAFNIASEESYVYISSWQKLIKNAKNGPFWRVFENMKLAVKQCYQAGHLW